MQLPVSLAALLLFVSPAVAVIVSGEQRAQPATLPVSSGADDDNGTSTNHLAKRFTGKASFYATGLGACGQVNKDSDFIVALNQQQYGNYGGAPSPWCGQMITISYGGKTTNAQIQDLCPSCPPGGLDMSPSLFRFFAPESVGIFYGMTWDRAGAAPAPSPTRQPEPTTTYTPPPPPPTSTYTPPSSTYTPPPPSSTYTPPPTTSSSSTTTSSSTRASIVPTLNSTIAIANATMSSNASSIASLPTAVTLTTTPTLVGGNLDRLSQIVLGLGGLVGAAAAGAGEAN